MMKLAIQEAKKSGNDIAIGAVIIKDGEVIAAACNRKETSNDVTALAEIVAIREAERKLANWRLDGCELYVTLEPCPMCAWAIIQSRMKAVYFGSYDVNYGALGSKIDLRKLLNSPIKVYGGIMECDCDRLLQDYFSRMRAEKLQDI